MNDSQFSTGTLTLPEWVILDASEVVRTYKLHYGVLAEFAFYLAFVVLMDFSKTSFTIRSASNRLLNQLIRDHEVSRQYQIELDADGFSMDHKAHFTEHLLAFEQGISQLRNKIKELKLVLHHRYVPYEFENLINEPYGHLLLHRISNYQYFVDLISDTA